MIMTIMFTMKTLEYVWEDGSHTTFYDYTIDQLGDVKNSSGHMMTRTKGGMYNKINVSHEGKRRTIRVGRALASTFLGKPPSIHHTTDHIDKNSLNDVLSNIRWLDKSGQVKNRTMPLELNSAFIIIRHDVEHTAKEWVEIFKRPNGNKYTTKAIQQYARGQKHGFRYKVFQDLPGEEWKPVLESKNSQGEWYISNMSRMKYKTQYAENVMAVDRLCKDKGYPVVCINGKQWKCHELSMMTFRPEEYTTKRLDFIILHEDDDKLDFSPLKLRWGTPSENTIDAYKNGKYDGTARAQKPMMSYVNGVFEKEHESLSAAVRYLRENGCSDANQSMVTYASENDVVRYGRTWKTLGYTMSK
ncbi:hypothetical protein ATCVTN60342_830L [Acanthocystis turfacea Chlorella virus TN603.4.2]|nr:hypothetical protein ATCVTN60342_830L [Acanthocystis turfacea Chlorella virus TN603.4.2]